MLLLNYKVKIKYPSGKIYLIYKFYNRICCHSNIYTRTYINTHTYTRGSNIINSILSKLKYTVYTATCELSSGNETESSWDAISGKKVLMQKFAI